MAISAYVGVPGSGKTYEVVKSVLLPAFLAGRRIITNIEGIAEQHFIDYAQTYTKVTTDKLGSIIKVTDEDMLKPDFFPFKGGETSLCHAGDLVLIDEVWRIWKGDKASDVHENHKSFIAEHRHFTHIDTGASCDIVVINQSVTNLPRFVKDRIETTYRMSKLKSLGLNSRYRVDVYTGARVSKTMLTTSLQCKYDKRIFELYKSYDGVNGQESATDNRQNILKSGKFMVILILVPLLLLSGLYFGYQFLSQGSKTSTTKAETLSTTSPNPVSPNNMPEKQKTVPDKPILSTTWRITGELKQHGKAFVILMNDKTGAIRLEPASQFNFKGLMLSGVFDNELITRYSGGTGQ